VSDEPGRNGSVATTAGFVTLGQIACRVEVLAVACNRCDRRGRLSVARLIAEHGWQLPVPELRHVIAADCPRMMAGHLHDVCGVHFPGWSDNLVDQIVSGSNAKYAPNSRR
jgi:hypothetical protein